MTTIHLARHGETVWHEDDRYAGSSDVALDHRGREQAVRLAAWARTAGLTRLVSSDQVRAMDTAAPVARETGLALSTDARLEERGFGVAEGLSPATQAERFPAERAAFDARPSSRPLPGGETGDAVVTRALAAVRDVVASMGADGTALVVAHGTLLRLVLCAVLGIDLDDYRRAFPVVHNTAITTLAFDGETAGLIEFNRPV